MSESIRIRPERLRNFGGPQDAQFVVVTEPALVEHIEIESDGGYRATRTVAYDTKLPFEQLLQSAIPEPAHVLVVLPGKYFLSPAPDALGPRRKLAVMACFSTPCSRESIQHFIRMAEQTDPEAQTAASDSFFKYGEASESLQFRDPQTGTRATFAHLSDGLQWHEQLGTLGWGEQQLFPSGELSVLPVSVFGQDIDERLDVSGELTFRGEPILHCGSVSYLPSDQARIYERLIGLRDSGVVAKLEAGRITSLTPLDAQARPAVEMLELLFKVDSRFTTLLEIGFGVNTGMELFPGNSAMNEVYGAERGAVHFGLGLLPYTQYHLDLICPGTSVYDSNGTRIFGGSAARPEV